MVGIFTGLLQYLQQQKNRLFWSKNWMEKKNCQNPFPTILIAKKKFRLPLSSRGMGVRPYDGTAVKKITFFRRFPYLKHKAFSQYFLDNLVHDKTL